MPPPSVPPLPAAVGLAACAHLTGVLLYGGGTVANNFHVAAAWRPYVGRLYLAALTILGGMTVWVTFVAGIVRTYAV